MGGPDGIDVGKDAVEDDEGGGGDEKPEEEGESLRPKGGKSEEAAQETGKSDLTDSQQDQVKSLGDNKLKEQKLEPSIENYLYNPTGVIDDLSNQDLMTRNFTNQATDAEKGLIGNAENLKSTDKTENDSQKKNKNSEKKDEDAEQSKKSEAVEQ